MRVPTSDILCLGGSFNPIHHAHLIVARSVAEQLGYARIRLIPAAQSPFKSQNSGMATAQDRLAMCRLAVADDPMFEVDPLELDRTGPSYTIDTVRAFKARGEKAVHWLIGMDLLPTLPNWHKAADLMNEVHWVVAGRPEYQVDWSVLPESLQRMHQSYVVQSPLVQISATEIRRRVGARQSIRYLTPHAVCDYIATHRLYADETHRHA